MLSLPTLTVCNITLKSLRGVLESPNFPGPYPNNRNCLWTIAAPSGNQIKYSFSHFQVEEGIQPYSPSSPCTYDYLEVIKCSTGSLKYSSAIDKTNITYC